MAALKVRAPPADGPVVEQRVSWSKHTALTVLGLWLGATTIGGAYLLAAHTAGLPTPRVEDPAFASAIEATRSEPEHGRWLVLHVLLQGCDCSRRAREGLATREPSADAVERVVLVGGSERAGTTLSRLGYLVRTVTPATLVREYRIEVAPLLVIVDPTGAVRYAGGYTDRRRGPILRDRELIARARRGERSIEALPVLGCAVSAELRAQIDPIGIRSGPTAEALANASGEVVTR